MRNRYQDVRQHYDTIADRGPYATLAPNDRGGRKSRYVAAVFDAALLPRMAGHPNPQELIALDFGCGSGILTARIASMGIRTVGIDLSPAILQSAQQRWRHLSSLCSFALTDGWRLPFSRERFDLIIARESLCFVPESQLHQTLSEFHRVMKSGGNMLILDQVSENPFWQQHPQTPLLKRRSVDELIQSIRRAGFQMDDVVAVRQPRFPWIYPVWSGIFPERVNLILAKLEVTWNKHLCPIRTNRWQDNLFVAHKP